MALTVTYSQVTRGPFQANSFEFGAQLAPDVLGLSDGGFVFAHNNVDLADGTVELTFFEDAIAPS